MRRRYCCQIVLAILAALFLKYQCMGAQSFSALQPSEWELSLSDGEKVSVEGVITRKIQKEKGFAFLLKMNQKNQALIVLEGKEMSDFLKTGYRVKVSGTVSLFQNSPNPGNFNQRFYYKKQKIDVQLKKVNIDGIYDSGNRTWNHVMEESLWELRQEVTRVICDSMGKVTGGVLSAMLVGEDCFLNEEWEEVFQKTGIGHLLAISALHVSFAGSGAYKGLRSLGVPRWCASLLAMSLLTGYVILSGASVSAVRAWAMFGLQMGAEISGREYDGCTALALTAGLMLLSNPILIMDAGFLLSFSAVFGIYVLGPLWKWKIPFAIQGAILPIQLYYFYEFSPYAILWNLLVIPLSAILLGSGIGGILCHFLVRDLVPIADMCFFVSKTILQFYKKGSDLILNLPGSRVITGQPSRNLVMLYYVILILGLVLYKNKKKVRKWKLFLGMAAMALIVGNQVKPRQVEVTMLNVGQGDCFVIQDTDGSAYMIDGGSSDVGKVGKYRIESFLKSKGISKLNYVWVTHGDLDHLSGIQELLERGQLGITIENLILPPSVYWEEKLANLAETAENRGSRILTMQKGQTLENGAIRFQCLWPKEESEFTGNEASFVLAFSYGETDILFTGDLEKAAEKEVAEIIAQMQEGNRLAKEFELLKAGHHGSKHATGEELLEEVKPKHVWISSGRNNRYGHPHQEVLERLAKRGINRYNTKDRSTVCLKTNGNTYCIECFRDGL